MLVKIALRNLTLNFSRRFLVASIIALTLMLLLVGNTIFQGTDSGIQQTYKDSFTGDLSISSESETGFTIFGSDLPLVGDYEVPPVLADPAGLEAAIKRLPELAGATHVVTAAAALQVGGLQRLAPLFGVDFEEYFRFFPALKVLVGRVPTVGQHAVLLNQARRQEIETTLGRPLALGEPIQFVATNSGGFTIRELAYAGAYAYPVSDELLDRIVLVDADTARALDGYVYGQGRAVTTDKAATGLLTTTDSVDDLFGEADLTVAPTPPMSLSSVESSLAATSPEAVQSVDGAWNFLLLRAAKGTNVDWLSTALRLALPEQGRGVQIRDWRGTAGGNAQLVYFVRLLFNVGLALIVLISIFIVTNSLALSVHERTRDIGTMRALGATRLVIAELLAIETVALVAGAGSVGLVLGMGVIEVLGLVGLPLSNPLIAALFGTSMLRPEVLWDQVAVHGVLAVALGLVALVLPLRVALRVPAVRAMATES